VSSSPSCWILATVPVCPSCMLHAMVAESKDVVAICDLRSSIASLSVDYDVTGALDHGIP
jgi:hypothetical protein